MESRPIELRARDDGLVEGTVVKYGDVAIVAGQPEVFERGALVLNAPALNFMHDRRQVIADSVSLTDSATGVSFTARLEDKYAAPIREMIATGLLTGASMEFRSLKERLVDGIRRIDLARIEGLALVDVPAYPASGIAMRRGGDDSADFPSRLELRQATGDISGIVKLGVAGITSMARRKKLLIPLSADLSFVDDVFLLAGLDYGASLASTDSGTLRVSRQADELRFYTVRNPRLLFTDDWKDTKKRIQAGLIKGARPGLMIQESDSYVDDDGYEVTRLRRGAVCEFYLTARGRNDGFIGNAAGRARRRGRGL